MHMWNVTPTQNNLYDCFFGSIVSFAESYELDFEMSLLGMWGFRSDKAIDHLITQNCLRLLAENHGLFIQETSLQNFSQLLNFITENIHMSPIIVSIDAINCPWCLTYQKYHFEHFILIVDLKVNSFMCVDSYFSDVNVNEIGFEQFKDWKGTTYQINRKLESLTEASTHKLYICIYNQLLETNMLKTLQTFLYGIISEKLIEHINQSYDADLYAIPLIIRLKRLAEDRQCFAKGLEYMKRVKNCIEVDDLIIGSMECNSRYTALKNIILRQLIQNKPNYKNIFNQCNAIIAQETKNINLLFKLIKQ